MSGATRPQRVKAVPWIPYGALAFCLISLFLNEFFRSMLTEIVAVGLTVWTLIILGMLAQFRASNRRVFWLFSTDLRTLLFAMAVLCFCLSIWTTHWPIKLRFQLSKTAFHGLVEQVNAGEEISFPVTVGLYRIYRASKRDDGSLCFSVSNSKGDFQGVAYCSDQVHFNIWTHIHLQGKWHYIVED